MWGSVQPNECWIDFGASCNTSWWGNRPQHGNSYHAMVESLHQLVLIRMCHLLPKFMNPSFHLPSSLTCSMRMDVYCAGASSPTPKQGGRRHPGASPFYIYMGCLQNVGSRKRPKFAFCLGPAFWRIHFSHVLFKKKRWLNSLSLFPKIVPSLTASAYFFEVEEDSGKGQKQVRNTKKAALA